ncbi:MAG: MsnO8 family LLM class oxidoreductase [Jeotgalicoccus halophilus]|nr:MsnO8 family LLM class oxidoreductase [Jeotgalicoccus aerolatus]
MEFNILNQSPILKNHSVQESLQHTVHHAKLADGLGYKRYFLSEHHNLDNVIGTAPEVLVTHLINHTKIMNIGAGGVMLSHHNPFHVAEQFQLISHLAPGRIDLGIGKAPGGTPLATQALQHELRPDIDSFNDRFLSLKSYIDGTHENSGSLKISLDTDSSRPTMFLLGGSTSSAQFAAENQTNYIFAHFIKNDPVLLKEVTDIYRRFNPDGKLIIALSVLAAETEDEKNQALKENEFYQLKFPDGKTLRVQTESQVNEFIKTSDVKIEVEKKRPDMILGSQEEILSQLKALSDDNDIDEFMFHLPTAQADLRDKTIQTLAPIHTIHKEKAGIL